ncbi:hypothetical protein [Bradyrhizobium sp. DASA03007]|uniref:hypothetical protein n=1 Tax=unclassified Bradyrhizobium TaxID=2631580 RepID=UPI003F704039
MAKMAKKKFETFTPVQVEAALCVWECLNEWTLGNEKDVEKLEEEAAKNPNSHAALRVDWIKLREDTGSGEMRSQSIVLGLWCLEIYDLLTKDDEEFFSWWSYDWEVIPCMLSHAVDKDGKVSMYRGDYIYTGKGLIDPHSAAQLVAQEFCWRKFEDECESQAESQWKYRGLVNDHIDSVRNAFEVGEEPAAFIKSLGEELELIDFK